MSPTLLFPSDYKNHYFLFPPSLVHMNSCCLQPSKCPQRASGCRGQRCSWVEEHQPPAVCCPIADASCLCWPLPFCLNLLIFKIQVVVYLLLPKEFHRKSVVQMGPSRLCTFYFSHWEVQNVRRYFIQGNNSITCQLMSLLAIFKGISTTSFYGNHTF